MASPLLMAPSGHHRPLDYEPQSRVLITSSLPTGDRKQDGGPAPHFIIPIGRWQRHGDQMVLIALSLQEASPTQVKWCLPSRTPTKHQRGVCFSPQRIKTLLSPLFFQHNSLTMLGPIISQFFIFGEITILIFTEAESLCLHTNDK